MYSTVVTGRNQVSSIDIFVKINWSVDTNCIDNSVLDFVSHCFMLINVLLMEDGVVGQRFVAAITAARTSVELRQCVRVAQRLCTC